MRALVIRVRGQVQGVGFRPHVWRQAQAHGVVGEVSNDSEGVLIQAQGGDLDGFVAALETEAPPLSRIDAIEVGDVEARAGAAEFLIVESRAGAVRTRVTPDAALCADCAAEILTPGERRQGYPFANCTHCGPRFTILESVPYDRAATTMRGFEMCADCRAEYDNPADRRFHAQPIACPACGPRAWVERDGARGESRDAISDAAALLREGAILAIKGLGGFHLACDALDEAAVQRLRERKRRPSKPFALMAADVAMARAYASIDPDEAALMSDPAAPIVLLAKSDAADPPLAASVAPGQWSLGWMLPMTPLHLLLMRAVGRPLVMTSGNLSGEPQTVGNDEAREKLSAFADAFLMHDRPIARRLDDSVARIAAGKVRMQRRARGHAPGVTALPEGFKQAPPVLAVGGQLKSALCLTRDGGALLTHHLGDLDDALTATEFDKAADDYAALFEHEPEIIAADLHPDYRSSLVAERVAARRALPLERVQHHHAHVAALMAETGWALDAGPVLGVVFDGLGLGDDGTIWGGEWLLCDYRRYERLAHLAPVPLPGGAAAQRDPWRNLLAQLDACGMADDADRLLRGKPLAALRSAIAAGVNAPLSSSAGRVFDAVAAALGCAPARQSFEGEAAMALETLARAGLGADDTAYPFDIAPPRVGPAPMWRALLADRGQGVAPEICAARFLRGLAETAASTALRLARTHGAAAIGLTGGCFQNMTLLELCSARLDEAGLPVLLHGALPPNDGSLALGQAAVAAARRL